MTILYGLAELEHYMEVFDTEDSLRHLPKRIGFVLAKRMRSSNSGDQTIQLLEEQQVPIPPTAYVYEEQFRLAMEDLQIQGAKKEASGNGQWDPYRKTSH